MSLGATTSSGVRCPESGVDTRPPTFDPGRRTPDSELLRVLSESTCVVGMGNPWRNDDGVGVRVVERLGGDARLAPHIQTVSVEDVIESYAFDIANRPVKNVVLVDAAMVTGLPAGSVIFGKVDELEAMSSDISTHKLALRTVESLFRRAGKDTYLLGIVSKNIDFGNEISAPVAEAADRVVDMVCSSSSRDTKE